MLPSRTPLTDPEDLKNVYGYPRVFHDRYELNGYNLSLTGCYLFFKDTNYACAAKLLSILFY